MISKQYFQGDFRWQQVLHNGLQDMLGCASGCILTLTKTKLFMATAHITENAIIHKHWLQQCFKTREHLRSHHARTVLRWWIIRGTDELITRWTLLNGSWRLYGSDPDGVYSNRLPAWAGPRQRGTCFFIFGKLLRFVVAYLGHMEAYLFSSDRKRKHIPRWQVPILWSIFGGDLADMWSGYHFWTMIIKQLNYDRGIVCFHFSPKSACTAVVLAE